MPFFFTEHRVSLLDLEVTAEGPLEFVAVSVKDGRLSIDLIAAVSGSGSGHRRQSVASSSMAESILWFLPKRSRSLRMMCRP